MRCNAHHCAQAFTEVMSVLYHITDKIMSDDSTIRQQAIAGGSKIHQSAARAVANGGHVRLGVGDRVTVSVRAAVSKEADTQSGMRFRVCDASGNFITLIEGTDQFTIEAVNAG